MSRGRVAFESLRLADLLEQRYFDTAAVELPVFRDGSKLRLEAEDVTNLGFTISRAPQEVLGRISQFGLKELWLGGSPNSHSRWPHSVGTFDVGFIWLKCLEGDN